MNVAICNAKPEKCSKLEGFINMCSLAEYEKIYVDKFNFGDELLLNIESGEYYDLVFIYCRQQYNDGSDIGNVIRNELDNQNINIVYISDYKIDASKLIDSRPIKLLIEPITKENILDVFNILHKIRSNSVHLCKIKNGNYIRFIPYKDILYFVSKCRQISAVTNKDKYTFYGKIKDLDNINGFIKVHKSFLINLNYVNEYRYKSIIMKNNDEIPISQSCRPSVRSIIENLS